MSVILYSLILIKKIDCRFALEPIQTLFSVAGKKKTKNIFISILSKVSEYIIVISCDEFLAMASCGYIYTLKAFTCYTLTVKPS